jgi:hypothetical protein
MSADEESGDGASPPDVESQVLDYDPPRARRRSSRGAFTSNAGAQQQPEPTLDTSPAPPKTERRVRNRPNVRALAMMKSFGDEIKG